MSEYNKHEYELVDLPYNNQAKIDKKLVPLIKELNKIGLITTECCQGGLFHEENILSHIVFELGKNVSFNVKPLGPNGQQRLVLYWKRAGDNILE